MKGLKQKIYQYTALFERNENNTYTVVVPSLPGLTTEGKNLEDARAMTEDAIQCYLEGLKKAKEKVPDPFSLKAAAPNCQRPNSPLF